LLDSITINSKTQNQIPTAQAPFYPISSSQNSAAFLAPAPLVGDSIPHDSFFLNQNNQGNFAVQNSQVVNRIPTFRVIENNSSNYSINNNGFLLPPSQKILKTESAEYKLPLINIDNSRSIDYYYPFFFKTKVIDYRQSSLPLNNVCDKCMELTCELCDIAQIGVCRKCRHGFFLHMGKCFNRCPINTIADIYKGSCNQLDHSGNQIYLLFFSKYIDLE